jgi:hypothetical protein
MYTEETESIKECYYIFTKSLLYLLHKSMQWPHISWDVPGLVIRITGVN